MTGFHVTMPSVMSFSELPSQLPWPLRERCPIWSPTPSPDQPTSFSLPGTMVVRLLWTFMCPASLDIHVISHLQQQTVREVAFTPGHTLQVGVQCKLASHLSACRSAGVDFIPIATEVLGGLAEDTHLHHTHICTKQLFHHVAISLWRGNASLWLHCQPILHPSVDGLQYISFCF